MGRVIKNIILDIGDVLVRFMPEEAVNQVGVPKHKRQAVLDATVGSVCSGRNWTGESWRNQR